MRHGWADPILTAASYIVNLEILLIWVRAILSWFRPSRYNRTFAQMEEILWRLTEPILGPIRDRLPTGGFGLDFSPIIATVLLSLAYSILQAIVLRLP